VDRYRIWPVFPYDSYQRGAILDIASF